MNIHISPGVYFKEQYLKRGSHPKFFHKRYLKRIVLNKRFLVSSNTNTTPITPNPPIIPFDVTLNTLYTDIDMGNNIGVLVQVGSNYYYYARFYQVGLNGFFSYDYQTKRTNDKPPINFKNINEGDKLMIKVIKAYDRIKELNDLIKEKPIESEYYTHTIIINGNEYINASIIEVPITEKNIDLRVKKTATIYN